MDVAAAAGVSQPTVSRALRGEGSVSAETRERVVESARALNYMPDRRAARLRSGSTGNLALVVLTMPGQDQASINPLYFALLGAVGVAASARGYNLLVSFQSAEFRTDYGGAREADGTIVIGGGRNRTGWRRFSEAAAQGEAIVAWGAPDDALPTVRCDNRAGAALVAAHFAELGRRRIALVCPGWRGQRSYRERREGFIDAARAAGLHAVEAPEVTAASREEQGHRATLALLAGKSPVDAVFAACDLLALGVARALRERRLAVPDDVALVGFDGIMTTIHTCPAITTVEQDVVTAGALLVETLLTIIAGARPSPSLVPVRLLERASSGKTAGRAFSESQA
jgi:DNA-binding LacI/PurR family transcriptional regulator